MTRPSTIPLSSAGRIPGRRDRIFARSQGKFDVRDANGVTQIMVVGEIGYDGISESAFRDQLNAAAGDVVVQINSPGGDVFTGISIYNLAVQHAGNIRVEVLGLAASAASIIAMAGDQIAMAQNAHLMIHRSWGLTVGNTVDHADHAALLAKIDKALAQTYAARSGQRTEKMSQLMTDETWLDAQEAISLGLATENIGQSAPAAHFDLSVYANVPSELKGRPSQATLNARNADELKRLLVDRAGLTRGAAEKITRGGWSALAGDTHNEIQQLSASFAAMAAELRTSRSL